MIKGFTEAAGRMRTRAKILRGQQGTLYRPDVSNIMRNGIIDHTDASYHGSEALEMAANSTQNWQHAPTRHALNILSALYANYRQYGCGSLPVVPLVTITDVEKQAMTERFARVLRDAK